MVIGADDWLRSRFCFHRRSLLPIKTSPSYPFFPSLPPSPTPPPSLTPPLPPHPPPHPHPPHSHQKCYTFFPSPAPIFSQNSLTLPNPTPTLKTRTFCHPPLHCFHHHLFLLRPSTASSTPITLNVPSLSSNPWSSPLPSLFPTSQPLPPLSYVPSAASTASHLPAASSTFSSPPPHLASSPLTSSSSLLLVRRPLVCPLPPPPRHMPQAYVILDAVTFNTILQFLSQSSLISYSLHLLDEMLQQNITPNVFTCIILMEVVSKSSGFAHVMKLLD